jgi:ribosomal protein L40E
MGAHPPQNKKSMPSFQHPKGMSKNTVCKHCGAENVTQAAWCEKCLTPFQTYREEKTLQCPNCFHPNDYNLDHCEVCHEPLKPGQSE